MCIRTRITPKIWDACATQYGRCGTRHGIPRKCVQNFLYHYQLNYLMDFSLQMSWRNHTRYLPLWPWRFEGFATAAVLPHCQQVQRRCGSSRYPMPCECNSQWELMSHIWIMYTKKSDFLQGLGVNWSFENMNEVSRSQLWLMQNEAWSSKWLKDKCFFYCGYKKSPLNLFFNLEIIQDFLSNTKCWIQLLLIMILLLSVLLIFLLVVYLASYKCKKFP